MHNNHWLVDFDFNLSFSFSATLFSLVKMFFILTGLEKSSLIPTGKIFSTIKWLFLAIKVERWNNGVVVKLHKWVHGWLSKRETTGRRLWPHILFWISSCAIEKEKRFQILSCWKFWCKIWMLNTMHPIVSILIFSCIFHLFSSECKTSPVCREVCVNVFVKTRVCTIKTDKCTLCVRLVSVNAAICKEVVLSSRATGGLADGGRCSTWFDPDPAGWVWKQQQNF